MSDKSHTLLELFKLHHAQMQHRREKIHRTSSGTSLAIYAIVAARYYLSDEIPNDAEYLICFAIATVAIGAIGKLYLDGRAYVEIMGVIKRLNSGLELYEPGKLLPNEAVYPTRWKDGVNPTPVETVSFHWAMIGLSAVVGCVMILTY